MYHPNHYLSKGTSFLIDTVKFMLNPPPPPQPCFRPIFRFFRYQRDKHPPPNLEPIFGKKYSKNSKNVILQENIA